MDWLGYISYIIHVAPHDTEPEYLNVRIHDIMYSKIIFERNKRLQIFLFQAQIFEYSSLNVLNYEFMIDILLFIN